MDVLEDISTVTREEPFGDEFRGTLPSLLAPLSTDSPVSWGDFLVSGVCLLGIFSIAVLRSRMRASEILISWMKYLMQGRIKFFENHEATVDNPAFVLIFNFPWIY